MKKFRRLAALVWVALLLAVAVFAAITLDVHTKNDSASSGLSSIAVTLNSVTTGDLLVACIGGDATGGNYPPPAPTTVSDNVNGAWSNAAPWSSVNNSGATDEIGIWYHANSASGNVTLTASWSSAIINFPGIAITAFKGAATSNLLDQSAAVASGSTANPSGNSITTTSNGELIYSCAVTASSAATAGSGFTGLDTGTNSGMFDEYEIQTTAGAIAPPFTLSAQQWIIQTATFRNSAASCTNTLSMLGVGTTICH